MTTKQDQYEDLTQKFHDRARNIANDLNKQLLTLSIGIVAAFFYLAVDKRTDLKYLEKIFILVTIILYGLAILCSILGMKWDASKNYFLGEIKDATKQNDRDKNKMMKEKYDNKQIGAKRYAMVFFLLGILGAITFLIKFILIL